MSSYGYFWLMEDAFVEIGNLDA